MLMHYVPEVTEVRERKRARESERERERESVSVSEIAMRNSAALSRLAYNYVSL